MIYIWIFLATVVGVLFICALFEVFGTHKPRGHGDA